MALMADEHLMSLQPGTVIGGRYEVVKCLGAGSMGMVYACRHRELGGHLVAVKVLFPEVARDKIAIARFRNEIFASYGVSHPNVVRAYEYFRDGDLVAYTMEYVGGGDLAGRISPGQGLPISETVALWKEMCAGIQAVHDAGIVHRDLKPENILLTDDGHVKITDFGIARTGHGPKLTEHGGVVGTIDYVSPEYILNSQVDWRSDIYALGILGYEMITGESPFRGDSVYATMTKRLKSDPKLPSELRPECPRELDAIIMKAMAREPENRYQAAAEIFYDLQKLDAALGLGGSSADLRGPPPVAAKPAPGPTYRAAAPEAPESAPPSSVRSSAGSPRSSMPREEKRVGAAPPQPRRAAPPTPVVTRSVEEPRRADLMEEETAFDTEPARMERVLGQHAPLSRPSPRLAENIQGPVLSGAIDARRVKDLAALAEGMRRPVMLDVVTWGLAVFIVVGVGFIAVKLLWPDLFRRSPSAYGVRAFEDDLRR